MKEFLNYGSDNIRKQQALFASFFVVQNKLQNSCEKVQTQISMRQWHLLAMTQICQPPRTLTNIGALMGCSRQNVKNLATALQAKGFVKFINGANNSVQIEITEKANLYLSPSFSILLSPQIAMIFLILPSEFLFRIILLYIVLFIFTKCDKSNVYIISFLI